MVLQPPPVHLSTAVLDPADGLRRESPRLPDLRDATYDARFDWTTLFYDCYRAGPFVVMQGPPFLNLVTPLLGSAPLARDMRRWFGRPSVMTSHKRGEIWWRSPADRIDIDGPIGRFSLPVQPDMAPLFAGRRVLHTLSKDNAPRWIHDWVQFYRAEHGADAVLIHDNGSTAYGAATLEQGLRAAFPDMVICVVAWPFAYGPQGGLAGAIGGRETPWDSDFCQTGSLQHARFRFLRDARSVLNVDIDELVLAGDGRSIFTATERSRHGLIKFEGQWISSTTPRAVGAATCRHADFIHRDAQETRSCPPKWCLVPARHDPWRTSWSVHNLFGSRHNRRIDAGFSYRHMTAISNSWKEDRAIDHRFDAQRFAPDTVLAKAFARAGLEPSAV